MILQLESIFFELILVIVFMLCNVMRFFIHSDTQLQDIVFFIGAWYCVGRLLFLGVLCFPSSLHDDELIIPPVYVQKILPTSTLRTAPMLHKCKKFFPMIVQTLMLFWCFEWYAPNLMDHYSCAMDVHFFFIFFILTNFVIIFYN